MTPSARKNSAALAVSTIEHVRRYRVRAVLLLDVCEDQHPFRADRAPVPEQFAGARLDHSFVCHVRIDESFDPDEVSTGRVRDGERFAIRRGEHLNAEDETGFALQLSRDSRHGGGDLRADTTLQIRPVVHVLDGQRRESCVSVDSCLSQHQLNQRARPNGTPTAYPEARRDAACRPARAARRSIQRRPTADPCRFAERTSSTFG